jgi:hypothetical protein
VTGEKGFLIGAILAICLAQVLRIYRWKMMVYKNGEISNRILSRSIGLSYLGNLILPFRLGELIRVLYLRSKQFGTLSVLLSLFLERLLDSILITLIFGGYFFYEKKTFSELITFSTLMTIGFVLVLYLAMKPQKEKLKILNFFSEDIQSKLHNTILQMYLVIRSFKLNFKAIIVLSTLINFGIFCSIILLSKAIKREPSEIVEILIFNLSNSISLAMGQLAPLSKNSVAVYIYLLVPILILLIPSYREIRKFKLNSSKTELESIRNMVRPEIRSDINEKYFKDAVLKIASSGREGLSKVLTETLQGEKVVDVLQGGGSGDQVFLIESQEGGKVRKSAPASRRNFLIEQNTWLNVYANSLPVVRVSKSVLTPNAAFYDMEYLGKESNLFNLMHSTTLENCHELFEELLQKLNVEAKKSIEPISKKSYASVYEPKIRNAFAVIEKLQISEFLNTSFENEGTTLQKLEIDKLLDFLLIIQSLYLISKYLSTGEMIKSLS